MTEPVSGTVTSRLDGGIATVSFFHPKGNSLPGALLALRAEQVTAAGNDARARVIVLRSEGEGAFCAGASFQELQAITTAEQGTAFFMGFARLILAMVRCPKFVIARVQGKAVGGGVGVIASSDYALAHAGAAVKLSELAVGIGPFVVGPVIERKIGPAAFGALAVHATGWRDAGWARDRGLFADTHDSVEALDTAVDSLARELAGSSPEAMARLKRVLWQGTDHWEALLPERAAMSGALVLTDFARRAITGR